MEANGEKLNRGPLGLIQRMTLDYVSASQLRVYELHTVKSTRVY